MAFVFLDESGRSKATATEHALVVADFATANSAATAKAFRKWQRQKFPTRKWQQGEIKFSDSTVTHELRLKTLQHIASLEISIRCAFFWCRNVPPECFEDGEPHDGRLYVLAAETLLLSHFPSPESIFLTRCDKRSIKGMTDTEFTDHLESRVRSVAQPGMRVEIRTADSASDKNLQIVDWIAGAIAANLNGKPYGAKYYEAIAPRFVSQPIELFKNDQ